MFSRRCNVLQQNTKHPSHTTINQCQNRRRTNRFLAIRCNVISFSVYCQSCVGLVDVTGVSGVKNRAMKFSINFHSDVIIMTWFSLCAWIKARRECLERLWSINMNKCEFSHILYIILPVGCWEVVGSGVEVTTISVDKKVKKKTYQFINHNLVECILKDACICHGCHVIVGDYSNQIELHHTS